MVSHSKYYLFTWVGCGLVRGAPRREKHRRPGCFDDKSNRASVNNQQGEGCDRDQHCRQASRTLSDQCYIEIAIRGGTGHKSKFFGLGAIVTHHLLTDGFIPFNTNYTDMSVLKRTRG